MSVIPNRPPSQSPSKSYNANPLFRLYILLAVRKRRELKYYGGKINLSDKLCVKYGHSVHLSEASTLRFLRKHTSIPVPKVYCAFATKKETYIVMQRVEGSQMTTGWDFRSEESKEKIYAQLREIMAELRALPVPVGTGVSSVDGGPLFHHRISGFYFRPGPFNTITEFHRRMRNVPFITESTDPEVQEKLIQRAEKGEWPLVFTNGDLGSHNIIVRGDKVVGITDWNSAGWFPSYWEYVSSVSTNVDSWKPQLDNFLDPRPEELEMERMREKLCEEHMIKIQII